MLVQFWLGAASARKPSDLCLAWLQSAAELSKMTGSAADLSILDKPSQNGNSAVSLSVVSWGHTRSWPSNTGEPTGVQINV